MKIATSFILAFLFSNLLFAQNNKREMDQKKPFVLGVIDSLYSDILHETRTVNIYLPSGYSDSSATYPVIYLLDGSADEDFIHIVGIVQFLTMIEEMPKSIIVGISNVDRRRDFTFPTTIARDKKDYPTTGGSENFMTFIEKELQPFIQKNYKTNHDRSITGQSLGGLFATQLLIEKPELFDHYYIISPSLWWDNESLLSKAAGLLKSQSLKNKTIYISIGNEGKRMENDANNLVRILKSKKVSQIIFNPMPGENHLTILHNSMYRGFQLIYKNQNKKGR